MTAKKAGSDVVSEVNMEGVRNAIQIILKELKNRFDFKGSTADTKLENDKLVVVTEDDCKIEQVRGILFGKLVKRSVLIKSIHFLESEEALGDTAHQYGDLISGIDKEDTKETNTAIKNSGIKAKPQV